MKNITSTPQASPKRLIQGKRAFAGLVIIALLISFPLACQDKTSQKKAAEPKTEKKNREEPPLAAVEPDRVQQQGQIPDPVGQRLMETGNYEKAVEYYRGLMSKKPDEIMACIGFGRALCAMEKVEEALSAYTECAKRNPESSPVYVARGLCKQMTGGKFEPPPEHDFKKAINIDPSNASAHNQLGLIYQARGDLEEAEDEFRMAIAYESDFFVAYNNLATVLISRGKYDKAISLLQKAISFKDDLRGLYLYTNLGIAFLKSGRTKRAEAAFLMETAINPQHLPAHIYLGNLYALTERYQDAAEEYNRVLLSRPENKQALINLGATFLMAGDHDQAIKTLQKAVRLYPDSPLAHFHLARAYREIGRSGSARKEREKAARLGYPVQPERPDSR